MRSVKCAVLRCSCTAVLHSVKCSCSCTAVVLQYYAAFVLQYCTAAMSNVVLKYFAVLCFVVLIKILK